VKKQLAYRQNQLSKWLLAITLVCNCFIFQGTAFNSSSEQQKSIQTELIFSHKQKFHKRIIFFSKEFTPSTVKDYFEKHGTTFLSRYNNLVTVKLVSLSKEMYSFQIADRFLQIKTIPQSSDEDIFSVLRV
jgi:hypothetical protein